jgi:hypothetical protein
MREKASVARGAGAPHFIQKRAGSSIGFVLKHRRDLVTQLRGIFVTVG